jgi:hypothetical protein
MSLLIYALINLFLTLSLVFLVYLPVTIGAVGVYKVLKN